MKHAWIAFAALAVASTGAWSHTDTEHPSQEQKKKPAALEKALGREGDAKKVTRVVRVEMDDTMRFAPSEITVKSGDTVRFEARNAGKVKHEIVLGTMKELKEHAAAMRKHPGIEHDEPYMAHVPPGRTGSVVWQFTKPDEFYYACLVPGHFKAGMVGKIYVKAR